MSSWAEDPELFLHKGQDGVVHVLRCKKETTATLSSSSMLMKPEDFTDEGAVTDLRCLTGVSYGDWDKNKYEALIDYIYPRHLLVNCHGSVIVELEPDEKSVLALLYKLFFLLFHWLLVHLYHINQKAAAVVYIRALDILDMGSYGPGPDHPGQAVPVRTIKYLQDGMIVQTEPTPKETKLSKELETLQQELLQAKEKTAVELAKEMELTKELAVESKELETSEQELLLAKEKIGVDIVKEMSLTEELARKSKQVETLQQSLAKEKTEMEVLIKKITEIEIQLKLSVPLPKVRIYTKANTGFSLTIRNGYRVVLGQYDPYNDACQYWVKDGMYGDIVKDVAGFPSFALVNKSTGQALRTIEVNGNFELVPYDRYVLDKSLLWTEVEQDDGYRALRKATDIRLNMTSPGSVIVDGNHVGLWTWCGTDGQKCSGDSISVGDYASSSVTGRSNNGEINIIMFSNSNDLIFKGFSMSSRVFLSKVEIDVKIGGLRGKLIEIKRLHKDPLYMVQVSRERRAQASKYGFSVV